MGTQQKGVNAPDNFGDGERSDIADGVGLGDLARDHALHITTLIETCDVGRDIVRILVPRSMLKLDVREALGHFKGGLHVAERSREDKFVSSFGEFRNRTFGVWSFRDVLHIGGLDLVPKLLFQHQPALIVGVGPAMVTRRAKINKPDFQFVSRGGPGGQRQGARERDGSQFHQFFHVHVPLNW